MSAGKLVEQVVAPSEGHTLIFESSEAKVFETYLKKGQKLPMHSHLPHIRYLYTAGKNLHTWPDGKQSVLEDIPDTWEVRESLEHAVENIGEAAIHSIIFDFPKPRPIRARSSREALVHPTIESIKAALPSCNVKLVADIPSVYAFEAILPAGFSSVLPIKFSPALVFSFSEPVTFSYLLPRGGQAAIDVLGKQAHWCDPNEWSISNRSSRDARILACFLTQALPAKL